MGLKPPSCRWMLTALFLLACVAAARQAYASPVGGTSPGFSHYSEARPTLFRTSVMLSDDPDARAALVAFLKARCAGAHYQLDWTVIPVRWEKGRGTAVIYICWLPVGSAT